MFNNREKTTSHTLLPARPAKTRALARRSPILFLAVALMALAVFFAPGAQPAQAEHGGNGHLSGLTITGTVTRGGETVTVPLIPNPWFDPHTVNYTIRVPSDLQSITFTPTWTDTAVTGVVLLERPGSGHSTQGATQSGLVNNSGDALTNSSSPGSPQFASSPPQAKAPGSSCTTTSTWSSRR